MQWAKNKRSGFTIVELLIVVVVIAILAAITIVAYTGIQNRAKASASQNTAAQSGKKLGVYFALHGDTYPTALTDPELGLPNVNATPSPYQYTVASDQKSYCLTTTVSGISYSISSTTPNPTKGACNGHGADGVATVTNLVPNPKPSYNYWFPSSSSVGSVSFLTVDGFPTARSTRITTASYALYSQRSGVATGVTGDTYTVLFSIKASTAAQVAFQVGYGSGSSSVSIDTIDLTTSWQDKKYTVVLPSSTDGQPVYPKFLWSTGVGAVNDYFDVTKVMWVKGTYNGGYADGSSAGWAWQGDTNASTSVGPPL